MTNSFRFLLGFMLKNLEKFPSAKDPNVLFLSIINIGASRITWIIEPPNEWEKKNLLLRSIEALYVMMCIHYGCWTTKSKHYTNNNDRKFGQSYG